MLCEYGCGNEANFFFKVVNKWCCSSHFSKCPNRRKMFLKENNPMFKKDPWNKGKSGIYSEETLKQMKLNAGKNKGKTYEEIYGKEKAEKLKTEKSKHFKKIKKGCKAWNKGIPQNEKVKKLISEKNKLTIEKIYSKYKLFSIIEEMRYNPNNLEEIQVHCKNHKCENSKEKRGWFTPTKSQLYERIRNIEVNDLDHSYFYCSDTCKVECPLFDYRGGNIKNSKKEYNYSEYLIFRRFVLKRDNYICQYCGNPAEHVHHERPQKIEPLFSLDPDFAWSCCEKCHYEKGHKDECSQINISKKPCH